MLKEMLQEVIMDTENEVLKLALVRWDLSASKGIVKPWELKILAEMGTHGERRKLHLIASELKNKKYK